LCVEPVKKGIKRGSLMTAARLWVAITALILACTSAYAQSDGSKKAAPAKVAVSIESQPIRGALRAFGEQTGLQVLYRSEDVSVDGVITPRVTGELSAQEALDQLLANTGLKYEFINAHTVRISTSRPVSAIGAADAQGRLAQAESTQNQNVEDVNVPDSKSKEVEKAGLEQIVVTGTHIKGAAPVGSSVLVIDEETIRRSGYTSTEQLIQSLPENIRGGAEGATADHAMSVGGAGGFNISNGSGANLRGLGSVATLVLINGRRYADSTSGGFVDLSLIPIAAIERIEILTDGASAIYGADAVAGVINIILKQNYDGAETRARYGFTDPSGRDETRLSQSLGKNWDGGNALVVLGG
jgi:iron complex outermembrane recepter protein